MEYYAAWILAAAGGSAPGKCHAAGFSALYEGTQELVVDLRANDGRIQPGQLCRVRVTSVKKPASEDRGHIEVEFISRVSFRLDDSMYIDPILSKKLQALLESQHSVEVLREHHLAGRMGEYPLIIVPEWEYL